MKVLSWNCRGLGNSSTVHHGKKIAQQWKPDFCFLLKTKLKEGRGKQLLQHWGFDGNTEVAHVGYSGGLALGWILDFQVTVLIKNQHFIHTNVVNQIGDCSSITFIYGHPVLEKRKQIWEELQRIGSKVHQKWLYIGDFNQVLSVEDKFALRSTTIPGNFDFLHILSTLSLRLIEAKGLSFTWMNKRKGTDFVMENLDIAFANIAWFDFYPDCVVTNLPIIHSDHGPIILDTEPHTPFKYRPFRFEWMWTTHSDCPNVVKAAWITKNASGSSAYCLTKKLEAVRDQFKKWNKTSFGVIDKQILEKKGRN